MKYPLGWSSTGWTLGSENDKTSAKSLEALVDRLCNVPGCWQDQPDIEIYIENQVYKKGQTNNA